MAVNPKRSFLPDDSKDLTSCGTAAPSCLPVFVTLTLATYYEVVFSLHPPATPSVDDSRYNRKD